MGGKSSSGAMATLFFFGLNGIFFFLSGFGLLVGLLGGDEPEDLEKVGMTKGGLLAKRVGSFGGRESHFSGVLWYFLLRAPGDLLRDLRAPGDLDLFLRAPGLLLRDLRLEPDLIEEDPDLEDAPDLREDPDLEEAPDFMEDPDLVDVTE